MYVLCYPVSKNCYIFLNIDKYNLLTSIYVFNFKLVFNYFFLIFHTFFGKYTLTYLKHIRWPLMFCM